MRDPEFGRNNGLFSATLKRAAEQPFIAAKTLQAIFFAVKIRCIKQGNPEIQRSPDRTHRLFIVRHHHRAKAQGRYFQSFTSQFSCLHRLVPLFLGIG
ncbi:hypothetical protein D3C80_1038350 [compost metagenome]